MMDCRVGIPKPITPMLHSPDTPFHQTPILHYSNIKANRNSDLNQSVGIGESE